MKKWIVTTLVTFVSAGWGLMLTSGTPFQSTADDGVPSGIIWFGVLEDGLAEARETGKPILLVSAAPQCAGVPGMW